MTSRPATDDLIAFLAARLDEDEAAARESLDAPEGTMRFVDTDPHSANLVSRFADEDRVLREVEAKRAILDEHYILREGDRNEKYEQFSVINPPFPSKGCGCVTCHYGSRGGVHGYGICRTVKFLAGTWSDHPDYQPEWKPS